MDPLQHYLWLGQRLGRSPALGEPGHQVVGSAPAIAPETSNVPAAPVPARHCAATTHSDNSVYRTLPFPSRTRMDGKSIATLSRNREHFWYYDYAVEDFFECGGRVTPLPQQIERLLVIGHDYRLSTGCTRPISHYLNAMSLWGGIDITSIELVHAAHGSAALAYINANDFVIVNSLAALFTHDNLLELVKDAGSRAAIYLHETQWIFDRLRQEQPDRLARFIAMMPELNIMCVSNAQRTWLETEFGLKRGVTVYNTSPLPTVVLPETIVEKLDLAAPLTIIMAGTLQPRKGVTLFSQVADLAKERGYPWRFRWAGRQTCSDEDIYKSPNVEWLGDLNRDAIFAFVSTADVFFLSSQDDPFPLCVVEALQAHKRVCVHQNTGVSELLDDASAPGAVFDSYSAPAALSAIRRAALRFCTPASFADINDKLSLAAFVDRVNCAIATFVDDDDKPIEALAAVLVIAHLRSGTDLVRWRPILTLAARLARSSFHFVLEGAASHMASMLQRHYPSATFIVGDDIDPLLKEVGRTDPARFVFYLRPGDGGIDPHDPGGAGLPDNPIAFRRTFAMFARHPEVSVLFAREGLCGSFIARAGAAPVVAGGIAPEGQQLLYDPEIPTPLSLLKNKHRGEDIYIVGAGPSGNFVDPGFFEGKIVVGVNRTFKHFPCTYSLFKEFANGEMASELSTSTTIPVIARGSYGHLKQDGHRRNVAFFAQPNAYFFDHPENQITSVDTTPIYEGMDRLVVSWSSITSAIHLAAYMGAKNVILVGHDCGLIDGKSTLEGYYDDMKSSMWSDTKQYADWLSQIEIQTIAVKDAVQDKYGCPIYSINPFVNLGLEGHTYSAKPTTASDGRPVLLWCNGPSARKIRLPADISNYCVVRMNFFFMEDEPAVDGRVDELFWGVNEPKFHDQLARELEQQRYQIKRFNCPLPIERMTYSDGSSVSERPFFRPEALRDHWALISQQPQLARLMMARPFPTTGLQALAAMACAGHRRFAIAGMDFYSKVGNERYYYTISDNLRQALDAKHLTPGYEFGAHSMAVDVRFLDAVLRAFPDIEIELVSEMPILSKIINDRKSK
jgi:glycosyltransferase involved in cell wall biosynthesis